MISRCYLATLAHSSSFPSSNHVFIFSMPPSKISFVIQLAQKNFILIFQIFTLRVCTFASTITSNVRGHIFLPKEVAVYPPITDSISNDHGRHITYAGENLLWHCENTPLSASLQLREEIMNFTLHSPDYCFANPLPGMSLFFNVPQFLQLIKTLVRPTVFPHLI